VGVMDIDELKEALAAVQSGRKDYDYWDGFLFLKKHKEELAQAVISLTAESDRPLAVALAEAYAEALGAAAKIADNSTYHHAHCDQYCAENCPTNSDVEALILALPNPYEVKE
jgi:hypothetical protein